MNSSLSETRFDAVVLGGGPAGATVAATLSRNSIRVLVAEDHHLYAFKVGESLPGIASMVLASAGFHGILDKVPNIKCSGNQSAWGSSQMQMRSGIMNPYGGGVHVDRAKLDQELLNESVAAGAQVIQGLRFQSAMKSEKGWTLTMRYGIASVTVECEAIVDCTGRRAAFARSQAAQRVTIDKQVAVVSLLAGDTVTDDDLTTTIEAARSGWWYSARIPDSRRVAVFFTDGDLLPELQVRSCEGFNSLMRQSEYLQRFTKAGYQIERGPSIVLADTSYLTYSADQGWCAAGDAAASLDPLASAGIVNAVKSGCVAAELILSGFRNARGYSQGVIDQIRNDIQARQSYYRLETRWLREPFWSRRCQPTLKF